MKHLRSWAYYLNLTKQRHAKVCTNCGCEWIDIAGVNKRAWPTVKTCSEFCASESRAKSIKARKALMSYDKLTAQCRRGGLKSAAARQTRSRDEIKLYELIASSDPTALSNYIIANGWDADIVLPNSKTAILWNGPWHYQQMPHRNHSLEQVQNRDRLKLKLFESLGWTVKVYEDRYWTPETAFQDWLKQAKK